MKAVRNINPKFGDPIVFDSLYDMAVALANIYGGENWNPHDALKLGRDFVVVRYMMNPETGSVDTEEGWREDFERLSAEEWGGGTFESAGLIYVERNVEGEPDYNPAYGEWRPED